MVGFMACEKARLLVEAPKPESQPQINSDMSR